MFRNLTAPAILLAITASASATVSASLDLLDAADPGGPTPTGVIVIDGLVTISAGDAWTASGIRCDTTTDVTLIYADEDSTIDGVQPLVINTGAGENRFVTLLSVPRDRNANSRFNNGATAIAGRYSPTGPTGELTPTSLNLAYFASPPANVNSPTVSGNTLRIALSAPGVTSEDVIIITGTTPPSDHPVVLATISGASGSNDVGWANATFDSPAIVGDNWIICSSAPVCPPNGSTDPRCNPGLCGTCGVSMAPATAITALALLTARKLRRHPARPR